MAWFLYIVKCADESLYTGITDNLEKRIDTHNAKKGAKSLKGKIPVILVYSEKFENKGEALKREFEIKSWNRKKKIMFIETANYDKN